MQQPKQLSKILKTEICLIAILVACSAIAWLIPITTLTSKAFGEYIWPQNLIYLQPGLIAMYTALFIFIGIIYYYIVKTQSFKTKLVFITISIACLVLIAAYTYPPIYDPIYYHLSAWLWITKGVNPYLNLLDLAQGLSFPVTKIPVPHNYIYGPLWLFVTGIVGITVKFNFFWFSAALKLISILSATAAAVIAHKLNPGTSLAKAIIFLVFSPIYLLFVLPAGNQEALISLMFIASLYFANKNNYLLTSLFLTLTVTTKISMLAPSAFVCLWLLTQGKQRPSVRNIVSLVVPIVLAVLIFVAKFGILTNMFSGMNQFLELERSGVSIPSVLGHLFSGPSSSPSNQDSTILTFNKIFNIIFVLVLAKYSITLLTRRNLKPKDLYMWLWKISLLQIYLSGITAKPWYLFPALAIALLINDRYQLASALITLLSTVIIGYFNLLLFFPPSSNIEIMVVHITTLSTLVIPLLVVISPEARIFQKVIPPARSLVYKLVPALKDLRPQG